jgi:hypothetical protein
MESQVRKQQAIRLAQAQNVIATSNPKALKVIVRSSGRVNGASFIALTTDCFESPFVRNKIEMI